MAHLSQFLNSENKFAVFQLLRETEWGKGKWNI